MEEKHRELMKELQSLLSVEQVTQNETALLQHGGDESYHAPVLPACIAYPKTTEEVQHIVRTAKKYRMPVIPYGRGTSLEGHVIPHEGGITVDFALMDQILEIRDSDFLVKVQPGVTRSQLNKELKKHGLFFTVDPGADATLGGMAATNASGTTSVKYGVMRDQVRDLEVVTAEGTIIHTGSEAVKSSSGYHLNGLFVGSEGTLGCFTELTLRVYGIPESIMAARVTFPSVSDAVGGVVTLLQSGIEIARVELVDEPSMQQVNKHMETSYKEMPTLFLELHGNEAGLAQDVDFMKTIMEEHACESIDFEMETAGRNQLWEARHNLAYAYVHGYPGKKLMVTDVCLPISQLAGAVAHAREELNRLELVGGIVGHVGDGNFHVLLMIDLNDSEEMKNAAELNENIVYYALARGGTCTGEHGVGIGKKKYQEEEHGPALAVMEKIKQALDPEEIMNPNKIIRTKRGDEADETVRTN
ncbi:FAD-binding oxidoreductase [Alkalicoccus saliphilus]|uniref:D-lactate dehydrogenase (cytochrome) n=1 Tax=Alkalicoccus saliphilus TaxID=200989 RepID=A0A2T4U4U4_9BACI|nr:FAD-linked oxidase C-terminal domain-containing protein [Alkalicoccus saliphilus]PTL38423.1 2-hydroxy-acid oxidase [Alkalicoccus saliphilus]